MDKNGEIFVSHYKFYVCGPKNTLKQYKGEFQCKRFIDELCIYLQGDKNGIIYLQGCLYLMHPHK